MKWFLFLLIIPSALCAKLPHYKNFQIWNSDEVNIPLSRNIYLSGNGEFRYGNDQIKLYYKHYQLGIRLYRSRHTHFYFGYRHIYHRMKKKWVVEYTPLVDLTFQGGNQRGLLLSNRNRIEYRILEKRLGGKNRWLYRNRTEFTPPYRLSKYQIAPYLADEFFWQEGRGIDQNRLEGGLKIPYHQRAHLNISYIWRHLKNPAKQWFHQSILRVDFVLRF